MSAAEQRVHALYAAFNARDADAVLAQTSADVDWPNAWEGGRLRGHEAVREYWLRQWDAIDPIVTPTAITERPDGSLAVDVDQTVHDHAGALLSRSDVIHVYTFDQGLIARMDVEEPA